MAVRPHTRAEPPVRRWLPRTLGDDRGVTLVLSALVLVTLLIFSAFAVDVGAVYNERRQDQTAADSAVLAAASPSVITSDQAVLDEVLDRLNANIPRAEFTQADLDTCDADAGTLPVLADVGGVTYNCVSFNTSRTEVRVQVPPRQYSTMFAHLAGVDSLGHSAFAIGGTTAGGFGGVLPFAITGGTGSGHLCLKTGPGGLAISPCEGPTSGNFGFLNFAHFGSTALGTPTECHGQGKGRVPANIAMGVDHDLTLYGRAPHENDVVEDTGTPCGSIAGPNAAYSVTGNIPGTLGEGLFSGSNFYDNRPARLQRRAETPPPYFGWTTIGPRSLDDNPLWEFIDSSLSGSDDVPTSCLRSQFVEPGGGLGTMDDLPSAVRSHIGGEALNDRMRLLLERCFAHYATGEWSDDGFIESASGCATYPCSDPVFARQSQSGSYDIQQTPRFGYVPVLVENSFPSGGSSLMRFDRFRAIFIQRVVIGQGSIVEFSPGLGMSESTSDKRSQGFTAFAFPDNMLPGALGSETAPINPANRPVRLLR